MAEPFLLVPKQRKTKHKFNRFQSDRFKRVKKSWRKPKGIDNRVRKKYSGAIKMPNKGYGTDKLAKHMVHGGFRLVQVRNVDDLLPLVSNNKFYCAEVEHSVGAKKRIEIFYKAMEYGIFVTNGRARLVEENKE